jgi:beta-galactosidase/beta-glucuronidase
LICFFLLCYFPIFAGAGTLQKPDSTRRAESAAAVQIPAAYQGPERVDLSGRWDFRFDPSGQGEKDAWFMPDAGGTWMKASVPGSFNFEFARDPNHPDPGDASLFYAGKVWYRTQFTGPRTREDVFLHFSGTVLRQKVWLNGRFVGSSVLPWLDVAYDVSQDVNRGAGNTLVVEVDNSILPDAIPDAKWRGWWNDGGLIWPVYIESRPGARAQSSVATTMEPGGKWRLSVRTEVHEDRPMRATVLLTLTDDAGRAVWREAETAPASNADVEIHSEVSLAGIRPWSPQHPELYRLTVRTTAPGQEPDVTWFRVGFRQIQVDGSRILLNGRPILLRGVNRHEFAPGVGQSVTREQNLRDMEDIKSLGANFVRLTHYSQSQDVYDDCDRLGLLAWTEIPAWQSAAETLASPEVWKQYAAPLLKETIEQHRNHPSVIVWSVANEIPSQEPKVAAYVENAIDYVHRLDPTRLATFASDKRVRDISMGNEDLISVNEYYGWYYGSVDDVGPMLDSMHAKYPHRPIFVSEYGAESVARWNPPDSRAGGKDYSYAHQAQFLAAQLRQIYAPSRRAYVAGGAIWAYNDFPDPHRDGRDQPDSARFRNSKGLVTMWRVPKPAYFVVKSFFHELMQAEPENKAK